MPSPLKSPEATAVGCPPITLVAGRPTLGRVRYSKHSRLGLKKGPTRRHFGGRAGCPDAFQPRANMGPRFRANGDVPCHRDTRSAKIGAWLQKGSGTFVRSTLRAAAAKVPDHFLNHAKSGGRLLTAPAGVNPESLPSPPSAAGYHRRPPKTPSTYTKPTMMATITI